MKTSEVRKAALRVALEIYETASGELACRDFDIGPHAERIGITDPTDTDSIWNYLTSVNVMEPRGIGERLLWFTEHGISLIESSLDAPNQPHGPFPPLNVVLGDVHAGAQVAIGSGSFNQSQSGLSASNLSEIIRLLEAAKQEWPEDIRKQVAGAEAAIIAEAESASPDEGLVKAAVQKIGKLALTVTGDVGTQFLLAYMKSRGWIA